LTHEKSGQFYMTHLIESDAVLVNIL